MIRSRHEQHTIAGGLHIFDHLPAEEPVFRVSTLR